MDIQAYCGHLTDLAGAFNREAMAVGIPVRMDPRKAIHAVKEGTEAVKAEEFATRSDDSGVIHENQIRTLVAVVAEMLADHRRHGLILGAMQAGKTGAANTLQFLGPILYMLKGIKPAVFYLLGNLTSHEAQTRHELTLFLEYYGDIEVLVDGDAMTLRRYQERDDVTTAFRLAPTLKTYRRSVTRGIVNDFERLELVHRRVRGQAIERIADICRRVTKAGCLPVIVADEPQFGASDGITPSGVQSDCVMRQVLDEIDRRLGGSPHVFVGLSATPYELVDLGQLWKVHLRLSPSYSGFNFFNGHTIDTSVATAPPTLLDMSQLGAIVGAPFLDQVDLGVFYADDRRFRAWATKTSYTGGQEQYKSDCIAAMRRAILHVLQGFEGQPLGICLRALNNNSHSDDLVARLNLPNDQVEVVRYFGSESRGQSIKQLLASRERPDLPVVILVTNRARMADAFPASVTHFIEFSKRAADRNSLLQGLFGRACGYGKHSTVVMSADNIAQLRLFERSKGASSGLKPSRHSVETRSRRPSLGSFIKLNVYDAAVQADSILREFLHRIQSEVIDPICRGPGRDLRASFPRGGHSRRVPMARIAEDLDFFNHLESSGGSLFPLVEGEIDPVRPGESIRHDASPGGRAVFDVDVQGRCQVGLRWSDGDEVRGGVTGRGRGQRDGATVNDRLDAVLEPQITLEKIDPTTGEVIPLTAEGRLREGLWRVSQVALPNRTDIRQRINHGKRDVHVYPVDHSPYSDRHMTAEEKGRRDGV